MSQGIPGDDDVRLNERQKRMMQTMIERGTDEREAKMRVMCIAIPPDHFEVIPTPFAAYPATMYHPDGRMSTAKNEADHKKAVESGWQDKPSQIHVDRAQGGSKIKLIADLEAELKKLREDASPEAKPAFEVPGTAQRRKR